MALPYTYWVSVLHFVKPGASVENNTSLPSDRAVYLGPAVTIEIEQGVLVLVAPVEVANRRDQLVIAGVRLGEDFAGWGDDAGIREAFNAFLNTALGYAYDESSILISATLHHQSIVEALQHILRWIGYVVHWGVVSTQDHFNTLEPHHAISLGPATIVADHHSHSATESFPYTKAFVTGGEVIALRVLEVSVRFVFLVPRYMHFSILRNDCSVSLN